MIGIAIAVRGQLCETKQLPANFIHATSTDIAEIKISPVTVGTNVAFDRGRQNYQRPLTG